MILRYNSIFQPYCPVSVVFTEVSKCILIILVTGVLLVVVPTPEMSVF